MKSPDDKNSDRSLARAALAWAIVFLDVVGRLKRGPGSGSRKELGERTPQRSD